MAYETIEMKIVDTKLAMLDLEAHGMPLGSAIDVEIVFATATGKLFRLHLADGKRLDAEKAWERVTFAMQNAGVSNWESMIGAEVKVLLDHDSVVDFGRYVSEDKNNKWF